MSGYSQPPPPGGYAPPPGYPPPPPPSYSYSGNAMMTPGHGMPPPPPPVGTFGGYVAKDPQEVKERMIRRLVVVEVVLDFIEAIMGVIVLCLLQLGHTNSPLPLTLPFTIPWIAIMLACGTLGVVFLIMKWEKKAQMIIIWIACDAVKVFLDLLIFILYIVIVASQIKLSSKIDHKARGTRSRSSSPMGRYWSIMYIWIGATAVDVIFNIVALIMMGRQWNSMRKAVVEPAPPPPPAGGSPSMQHTPLMT